MTRSMYGPIIIAIPGTGNTLTSEKAPVTVARTEGGAAEHDLTTVAGPPGARVPGTAITAPDPDDTTGAAAWFGPDGYTGSMWVLDPATGTWFEVYPVGLVGRIGVGGTIAGLTLNGNPLTPNGSGIVDVTVSAGNLSDASDTTKAFIQAADKPSARAAIGALAITDIPATSGIPLSTVTTKGDLIVGTASATVARLPAGTTGQVVSYDPTTATGLKAVTPTAAPDLTPYATKAATIRQFLDVPDNVPPDGSLMMWDGGTNTWAFISPTTLLTAAGVLDGAGRISTSLMPKYYHDTPIINQGDDAPVDAYSPIVFERPGVGVLTPTKLGENSVQGASACAVALSEPLAIGDNLILVAGASGDISTPALGSVSASFSAGAPSITWVPLNFPNGSAAVTIGLAKVTAAAATAPTVTFTARDTGGTALNRVHFLAGVFRAPGVASTTPMDVAQNGNGNASASMTAITTAAPTADLAQANELVFSAAVWNSGSTTVDRSLAAAGNWTRLMLRKSDNGGTGRSLAVFYEQVTAGGRPVLQSLMTSNEATPSTGQWAAQLLPLKVGA